MSLTQGEADYLMELEKRFTSNDSFIFGPGSIKIMRDLISLDGREKFEFDAYRGSLSLTKYTYQERARGFIPLIRLDIGKTLRHPNPDGSLIEGSHIHIYREGYDIKFAFSLTEFQFPFRDPSDLKVPFEDFARYCNILDPPAIQGGLI